MDRSFSKSAVLAVAFGVCTLIASRANATLVTLTDLNSTVDIDTGSQAGVYNWTVDGTDHLFQQWFWYRIGSTGPESSIDTLGQTSISNTSRILDVTYAGSGLSVNVLYTLTGGSAGSNTSDLAETIRITNTSTEAITLSFFQYSDFDIGGDSGNDYVWYNDSNQIVDQADPNAVLSETVHTPAANRGELAFWPTTLANLTDGDADDLAAGDLDGFSHGVLQTTGDFVGPGDVTWAYQWTVTIAAGGSFIISKDKNIAGGPPDRGPFVPEPASLAIWGGLSVLGLVFGNRFRRQAA
jgi:hypothetical protein